MFILSQKYFLTKSLSNYFSFRDSCNAFLISFKAELLPYIKTPPLKIRVPIIANRIIVATNIPIDRATSQIGIFKIPTLKTSALEQKTEYMS